MKKQIVLFVLTIALSVFAHVNLEAQRSPIEWEDLSTIVPGPDQDKQLYEAYWSSRLN